MLYLTFSPPHHISRAADFPATPLNQLLDGRREIGGAAG